MDAATIRRPLFAAWTIRYRQLPHSAWAGAAVTQAFVMDIHVGNDCRDLAPALLAGWTL